MSAGVTPGAIRATTSAPRIPGPARAPSVRLEGTTTHLPHEPTQRGEGRVTADTRDQHARAREPGPRSSSGSPATPATACSSPATASPTSAPCSATTWRRMPELPGRDPGAGRHHRRRLVVPGAHLRPRHRHAGRRAERARRDEPRGAQGQPRRAAAGLDASSSTPTRSTTATSTRSATTPTRSTTARSPRTASSRYR